MDKKYKILIADDEEMLRDLYSMILESEINCDFIKVKNGEEAIAELQKNHDIDLIISDYGMPKATGGDIYTFNKANNKVPFFLFSGGDLEDYAEFNDFYLTHPSNTSFGKPFNEEDFVKKSIMVLTNSAKDIEPIFNKKTYIKIYIDFYSKQATHFSDVYIKLNRDKFTKIINKDEPIEQARDLISHYQKKGVEHLYVSRKDFEKIIKEQFILLQFELLKDHFALHTFSVEGLEFSVSYDGLSNIGISINQINQTTTHFQNAVSDLFKSNNTKKYFQELTADSGELISHSLLIIYIASAIIKCTDLDFQNATKKIILASIYHDAPLIDIARIQHYSRLENITDRKLLNRVAKHPIDAQDYIPETLDFSSDIKKIILEHHELPDGDGYPKKLTAAQISPLACLFVISQEISHCLMRNDFSKERLIDFLNNNKNYFEKGNFTKFYKAACSIFLT